MNKVLSICIASYNKSEHTTTLVKNLLTCNNPEFEIVVVDNASTDDTVKQLNLIKDDRLRIIVNQENIGGARNFLASVFGGEGTFCLYTNDRDIIFPEKLDTFIAYLKQHDYIGGGHCTRNKCDNEMGGIEYKGVDALLTLNFRGAHPTGFFFKRSLLNDIPNETLQKYGFVEPYLSFPWEGFLCEIICNGFVVVQYNDVIWQSTGDTTHSKYTSGYYIKGDDKDRWFFPNNRLQLTIAETSETLRLAKAGGIELSKEDRYKLYAHVFKYQYAFAVYRYKVIYETPSLAYHYKVPCRKVSKKEMKDCREVMIGGYINYIRNVEGGQHKLESYIYDEARARDKKYYKSRLNIFRRIKGFFLQQIKNNA